MILSALLKDLGWKEVERRQPPSRCDSTNTGACKCLGDPDNRIQATRDRSRWTLRIKLSVGFGSDYDPGPEGLGPGSWI